MLGGPPGSLVPGLDVQLDTVNAVQGQTPPGDGIQSRGGVTAAAELGCYPVTRAGPPLDEIPQPKARLADRFARGRVGDRK